MSQEQSLDGIAQGSGAGSFRSMEPSVQNVKITLEIQRLNSYSD
jgi:hypothetical protein